jgi:hypothetical protein
MPLEVGRQLAGLPGGLGAPYVLVVDEELQGVDRRVEERQHAVDSAGLANQGDQLGEGVLGLQTLLHRGGSTGQRRHRDARHGVRSALAQHQMRGQVVGVPALAQGRGTGAQQVEQVAQCGAFATSVSHIATLPVGISH